MPDMQNLNQPNGCTHSFRFGKKTNKKKPPQNIELSVYNLRLFSMMLQIFIDYEIHLCVYIIFPGEDHVSWQLYSSQVQLFIEDGTRWQAIFS